ncbi:MAG: site-specific integrase [Mycobacterium sp.]|nr:MAG: site-specific integrase [Mycobacterium sp.]
MPRQRMAPGKWGKVTDRKVEITEVVNGKTKIVETRYYATTYVRLHSGKLREREVMSRKSAEDARRELLQRIDAELDAGEPTGVITSKTTLSELFEAWITAKVVEDGLKPQTAQGYRDAWRLHGEQQLGELRIAELTTSRANAHLQALPASAGKQTRIVLVGMYGLAARHDVVKVSPIDKTKLTKTVKKDVRALTGMELEQVRQAVKAYCTPTGRGGPRRGVMLPAYVELLAATGGRPAEVLAIRWPDVDLLADPATVTISGTLIDHGVIPGKPLHRQDARKGGAPPHTVVLPAFGVQVLTELYAITGPDGPVLTNRDGGWISPSNIATALREALSGHEHLVWVSPHSFRRSVATAVRNEMGVEAAQQQLSHAQLATTEGHYVQRVTAGPDTRAALDKWAGNAV